MDFNKEKTAFILVDFQKPFYSDNAEILRNFPQLKENVIQALAYAREKGMMVVHVRAEYNMRVSPWMKSFRVKNPTKWNVQYPTGRVDDNCTEHFATENTNELVIRKSTFDGFNGTQLHNELLSNNIESVIICGIVTGSCVLNTANGAYMRGYRTGLLVPCCADRNHDRQQKVLDLYGDYMFDLLELHDFFKIQ